MRHYSIIALFLCIAFSLTGQDRESDSLALVSIYNDLGGPMWTENGNWLSEKPLEEWSGVKLDSNRVSELQIANISVPGIFPDGIYDLSKLQDLNFFNLNLEGSLSEKIANLTVIRRLTVMNCGISGIVPTEISQLTELNFLRLGKNNLIGTLPELPPQIETFHGEYNEFEGQIPNSWADLNLEAILIDGNNLTGNFDVVGTMENINNIVLSNNNWNEGLMPEWLDNLPNLKRFLCTSCNLIGEIPDYDFSNTPRWNQIFIDNNQLSGNLSNLIPPAEIQDNFWLQASNNQFEGELPLDEVHDFFKLYVNGNRYSSLSSYDYTIFSNLRMFDNNFIPSGLLPELDGLLADTLLNLLLFDQNLLLKEDTLMITEATTVTIEAGDDLEGNVYSWFKDDQLIDGETVSTLQVLVNEDEGEGAYFCEFYHPSVVTNNGDVGIFTRNYLTIEKDITSSNLNLKESNIVIFPNPTRHQLNFSKQVNGNYMINDVLGNKVKTGKLTNASSINISDLIAGHYFLSYSDKVQSKTMKFTIQ